MKKIEEVMVELEIKRKRSFEVTRHVLVGHIIEGKEVNRKMMHIMYQKSWGNPTDMQITYLAKNTFMFTFREARAPVRILNEGPWNILGNLLSLQVWPLEITVHKINYDCVFLDTNPWNAIGRVVSGGYL